MSCDADGAFIGAIPILNRMRNGDKDEWCPRDCDELSKQVGEQFGLPIDMSSKTGGLTTIAKALNEGDVARAQIAAVLLGIPDPPPLSKGNPSREQMIKLIRDLHWSGMIKADWDADSQPFNLKDASKTDPPEQFEEIIAKAGYNPDEPRDERGRWANGSGGSAESDSEDRSTRIQLADAGMSDAYNDPVAEAVRAAAARQRNFNITHSNVRPVGNDKQSFWETLGSGLSHEAKSSLLEIGQVEADQSYTNLNEAADEARGLEAYADYRTRPWIGPDGRQVQVPVYYTGHPYGDGFRFLWHELFEPNTPSTRPGTNADWLDPLIDNASLLAIGAGPAVRSLGVGATALADASQTADATLTVEGIWAVPPIQRGIAIEQKLATTEYTDWYHIGQENNGYFPLVDFQKGDTLVSLRTADTTGTSWFGRTSDHIIALGRNEAEIDGDLAKMILDLRVQPGGLKAAQPLVIVGKENDVTVLVKEFP